MARTAHSLAVRSYKVGIQRVADHVRRDALLAQLTESHRRAKVTWVVGLPGSGKTSLVARWIEESDERAMVYRLDADDADGAAWVDAVAEASASDRSSLPVWSPENQADLADFARPFFAALTREPLTLVIDDGHRVSDDAPLFAMLGEMREVAGDALRLVVISRRAPPPALARGLIGGWLALVDDLRLTPAEAIAIARAATGDALRAEDQAALAGADGWLAYVLALSRRKTSVVSLAEDPSVGVGEFLATELLASLPKEHRASLRHLAELPAIPDDARGGWVVPEVRRLLTTLSAQRYFVEAANGRFRLHDLLRDALMRMNAGEDTPDQVRDVRCKLADWVAASMPEVAMQLRSMAADTDGALALLAVHGSAWLARGLHTTVGGWLHGLAEPADASARAALSLWRAQALLPVEPERARPLFAASRAQAIKGGDAVRAYTAWCGEVESYVIQWGAVHGLADLVDDLESLQRHLAPADEELTFRTSAAALTALMYGRAEDPRIARFAEATARAVTHAPDAGARISAAAQLLIYKMWWAGDFPGGRALYDTFDAEVSQGDHLDALPRLLWWSNAAIVDWQCGSPAECFRKVDRGLALAASSGVHVRDFFLLTQGIFCALNNEDWPRAEAHLAQLARTERTHKRLDVMVHHFFRSWYALSRGDARTALAHAESAWPIAEAIGSMFHKVIVLSALGPARVHTGDLAGAEAAYRAQLALAKRARNPTFSFIAFCAGAEIAIARGDDAALRKQVERILVAKDLGGFHSICGWRTPVMQQLLSFALAHGIEPAVARAWIHEKKIPPPADASLAWPRLVRIEGANGLTVSIDGRAAVPSSGNKSAKKVRTLVAVLAARASGVSQVQLADWLWPDADGDRATNALKVTIHRARKWLGKDAIVVHGGRVRLNAAVVDCDLWHLARRDDVDPARVLLEFDEPPIRALRSSLRNR